MKKYRLKVIIGNSTEPFVFYADCFYSTTNNSTSSGYYSFYSNKELVACYPIDRTIIESIENIEA